METERKRESNRKGASLHIPISSFASLNPALKKDSPVIIKVLFFFLLQSSLICPSSLKNSKRQRELLESNVSPFPLGDLRGSGTAYRISPKYRNDVFCLHRSLVIALFLR